MRTEDTPKSLAEQLTREMYSVLCVLNNTSRVLGKSTISTVLKNYSLLVGLNPVSDLAQGSYISYKPVTLQLSNLDQKTSGIPGNILQNYAVTEKADGDRMLMYIFGNNVYLINDRFKVYDTGANCDTLPNNTLIDGEFIRKADVDIYLGFDIYYHEGKDVRGKRFVCEQSCDRLSLLQSTMKLLERRGDRIMLLCKQYRFGSDRTVFERIAETYRSDQYMYNVDGLIFQPTNLPCGNLYEDHSPEKHIGQCTSLSTTWARVYKWKPPFENTIDFMILFQKNDLVKKSTSCKLCVHNNYNTNAPSSVSEAILQKTDRMKLPNIVFAEQNMPSDVLKRLCVKNYDVIESRFEYSEDKWKDQFGIMQKGRWVIHRKRKDKTEQLRKVNGGILQTDSVDALRKLRLGGSANAVKTANSVYTTIADQPVSLEVLEGKVPLKQSDMTAKYYVNTTKRSDLLLYPMQRFHNQVKEGLIGRYSGQLVDVACGVGGDIFKYEKCYDLVLGFDISYDGIFGSPEDSAYLRYCTSGLQNRNRIKTPMLFLNRDMTTDIFSTDTRQLQNSSHQQIQKVSNFVFETAKTTRLDFGNEKMNKKLGTFRYAVQESKFDVVSCQFALHYFFADAQTLDRFCFNINSLLKSGGHFIGTCFDGEKLNDEFVATENGRLEGRVRGNIIWRIDKRYDDFDPCGSPIDVFIESIGQSRREYMVSMPLLQEKLRKYKIEMHDCYSFRSVFTNEMKEVHEDIRRLSSLYQAFVFVKN